MSVNDDQICQLSICLHFAFVISISLTRVPQSEPRHKKGKKKDKKEKGHKASSTKQQKKQGKSKKDKKEKKEKKGRDDDDSESGEGPSIPSHFGWHGKLIMQLSAMNTRLTLSWAVFGGQPLLAGFSIITDHW